MGISSVNLGQPAAGTNANGSQSQAAKALLNSIRNQPTLLNYLSDSGGTGSGSSGDILDLSSQGQAASDQLYRMLESQAIGTFQGSADKASSAVHKKLDAALAESGIDTSVEIDLQIDSSGKVVVANNNPQKQQIEDAINNNRELKKAVTEYQRFLQAIAPALEGSSGDQSGYDSTLTPLLSSFGGDSLSTVTLALQGKDFAAFYQDGSNKPLALASSQLP